MGELIVPLGLLLLLSVPLITARLAKRLGRRPWLWFFIGIGLPVIASLILCLLPDLSEPE
jgi:MFS family permease